VVGFGNHRSDQAELGDGVELGYDHHHRCIDPLAAEFTDVEPRDDLPAAVARPTG